MKIEPRQVEAFLKKPDPRIYRLLFERFAVTPERSLFIDDSARNVGAARECGLKAIHFQSPEALSEELGRFFSSL